MQIGVASHRSDGPEAGTDVACRGDGRRDPRDEVCAKRHHHRAANREHEQVEQEEHEHRPHDFLRDDARAELYRENAARMHGPPELEQGVPGDQHLADHLRASGRGPCAPADEHEHKENNLRLVVPEFEVRAGISRRRQDAERLEQRDADAIHQVAVDDPKQDSDQQRRHQDDPCIRAELLVSEQHGAFAPERAIVQREVRAGKKHEEDHDPLDRAAGIAGD
jgi:hypothetical protein